jgi:hypothetical protein
MGQPIIIVSICLATALLIRFFWKKSKKKSVSGHATKPSVNNLGGDRDWQMRNFLGKYLKDPEKYVTAEGMQKRTEFQNKLTETTTDLENGSGDVESAIRTAEKESKAIPIPFDLLGMRKMQTDTLIEGLSELHRLENKLALEIGKAQVRYLSLNLNYITLKHLRSEIKEDPEFQQELYIALQDDLRYFQQRKASNTSLSQTEEMMLDYIRNCIHSLDVSRISGAFAEQFKSIEQQKEILTPA